MMRRKIYCLLMGMISVFGMVLAVTTDRRSSIPLDLHEPDYLKNESHIKPKIQRAASVGAQEKTTAYMLGPISPSRPLFRASSTDSFTQERTLSPHEEIFSTPESRFSTPELPKDEVNVLTNFDKRDREENTSRTIISPTPVRSSSSDETIATRAARMVEESIKGYGLSSSLKKKLAESVEKQLKDRAEGFSEDDFKNLPEIERQQAKQEQTQKPPESWGGFFSRKVGDVVGGAGKVVANFINPPDDPQSKRISVDEDSKKRLMPLDFAFSREQRDAIQRHHQDVKKQDEKNYLGVLDLEGTDRRLVDLKKKEKDILASKRLSNLVENGRAMVKQAVDATKEKWNKDLSELQKDAEALGTRAVTEAEVRLLDRILMDGQIRAYIKAHPEKAEEVRTAVITGMFVGGVGAFKLKQGTDSVKEVANQVIDYVNKQAVPAVKKATKQAITYVNEQVVPYVKGRTKKAVTYVKENPKTTTLGVGLVAGGVATGIAAAVTGGFQGSAGSNSQPPGQALSSSQVVAQVSSSQEADEDTLTNGDEEQKAEDNKDQG
ncbi:MAG: hypothetical protein WCT20_00330 [Candidatus Babeliales bacterium]